VPSVSFSRSTALVGVSVLLVVLVLAGHRLAATGAASGGGAGEQAGASDTVAPLEPVSTAAPTRLVVHVVGAVRRPGLYRLRDGSRAADAVARAGGATRHANLGGLNLAAPLVDGTQVLVPARIQLSNPGASDPSTGGSFMSGSSAVPQKVSLSTATAEQLDELPGGGPVTAQKILDYRAEHGAIGSVDELDAIPGIGPARVEQLRDLVTP
jgi:competence protein ComEA